MGIRLSVLPYDQRSNPPSQALAPLVLHTCQLHRRGNQQLRLLSTLTTSRLQLKQEQLSSQLFWLSVLCFVWCSRLFVLNGLRQRAIDMQIIGKIVRSSWMFLNLTNLIFYDIMWHNWLWIIALDDADPRSTWPRKLISKMQSSCSFYVLQFMSGLLFKSFLCLH